MDLSNVQHFPKICYISTITEKCKSVEVDGYFGYKFRLYKLVSKFIRVVTVIAIKYNVNVAGLHFILFDFIFFFVWGWGAVTKKYSAIIQTFIF